MLYTDRHRLGRMLIEVALSNRSRSSDAVYYAVLALASYHRGDTLMRVDRHKRAALKSLYLHLDPDVCEATEHVAANLILCVLEVRRHCHGHISAMLTVYRCNKHPAQTPLGSAT